MGLVHLGEPQHVRAAELVYLIACMTQVAPTRVQGRVHDTGPRGLRVGRARRELDSGDANSGEASPFVPVGAD
jgi:hypothetical protein